MLEIFLGCIPIYQLNVTCRPPYGRIGIPPDSRRSSSSLAAVCHAASILRGFYSEEYEIQHEETLIVENTNQSQKVSHPVGMKSL